jgi:Tfp pilus assembly protein PilF
MFMNPAFFIFTGMKKLSIVLLLLTGFSAAQSQDAKELHETAKTFMRQGDHANAILVLNRALQQEPKNIAMAKDLALSYYFQRENGKAIETINSMLEREEADDQCFQIAGMIYKQADMNKDAEKMYKKGLKRFPESGPLYNELGELQWQQKNYEAIKQWEKGIETDPSYSKNYYNAARFYYLTTDKVWALLYGEIFINMEPLSTKSPEIKQLLLDGYKKLFSDANLEISYSEKNPFIKNYLKSMNGQTIIAAAGINAETLSMIRTRFVLDWYNNKTAPSFKLFNYHQQLLREGLFEAYNQWLFGSAQNLSAFQVWVNMHADEYNAFLNFQKGRIFKITGKEYYH